jgi:PPOX class probable F420-dependent enzyme
MNADEVRDFIRTNHRAVLGTSRQDGGIQMSPILIVLDDSGEVLISTREPAMKVRNLRRKPYAYLCVLNEGFFGGWAQAEGPVEIVSLPEAMDGLIQYYRLASGEHPDWDDYRAAMERDRRVLIRMRIERAGPTVQG